ncbi:hypothetical protein LTSESEN_1316 [Salmonella enterica subsp. enterica serovar Senftenberg str. A4-543]|uniref:Uncharacterized protein n=1 Tax=Salmonella enterica subsp. enterica serovar Senftenberg str. A4-543 TaxID=913082 RepID=G5QX32_SALSE|nr:hypothetical protein LTSESEN_1316 [Salmonella enterica subsp. enterica serovar Senftenberg str. A4-543]
MAPRARAILEPLSCAARHSGTTLLLLRIIITVDKLTIS